MRLDDPRATLLNQPTKFGPGTVAIIASDLSRYTAFWMTVLGMQFGLPAGSSITGLVGSDIAGARNDGVAAALERDDAEWIWFIDDDHEFPQDIVMRLLSREVDIVTPLVLRRQSPFMPVATVNDDFLDLNNCGPEELIEVQFAGSSGMLIRRKVLEALADPWFELGYDAEGRRISEDVNFCKRAAEAGFKVHVDMSVTMTHLTTASILPTWDEEKGCWMLGLTVADGYTVKTGITSPDALRELQEVEG